MCNYKIPVFYGSGAPKQCGDFLWKLNIFNFQLQFAGAVPKVHVYHVGNINFDAGR